ncbi:MAG: class I SAM-dependent methyltransferase [Candidatus Aenigmatarchaeota archaeon]
MFFPKVYKSWNNIQKKKYSEIFKKIVLSGLVLDLGCGPSRLEKFISGKMIRLDVDKACKPDIIASGDELPFKNDSFDAVISIDTMHLVKGSDFKRVLKPRGLALFSLFFNKQNYDDRKAMLIKKLESFDIANEFTIEGKENEYVVLAKK